MWLFATGQVDGAAAHYRKAVELSPEYPEALNHLGNWLVWRSQFDEVIPYLENAIALNPGYNEDSKGSEGPVPLMRKARGWLSALPIETLPIWCNVVNLNLFDEKLQQRTEGKPDDELIVMSAATQRAEPRDIDQARIEANGHLNPARKVALGQFMTPGSIAQFMATLFSERAGELRLLDAGAGVGSLTDAFVNRWSNRDMSVAAYEIDPTMVSYLRKTFGRYGNCNCKIIERDFIQDAVYRIKLGNKERFTNAILNPPYKKINSDSQHRALLRAVGLETVNLYTAFVGLAIELMEQGGEIVAIIPRSFCNGLYYKPFREWMLGRTSLDHVHLFHSRTSAFTDDEVLQENVIVKLVRGKKQGRVTITTSSDPSFSDLAANDYPFSEIVHDDDEQKFIHVPMDPAHSDIGGVPLAVRSLADIGLEVSTGPVVDFRLKEFLCERPEHGDAPLLYPAHFVNGSLEWPRQSKKPNAIANNAETRKWLYPNGFYTIVRRFSSKEERRRIVSHVVDPDAFKSDWIGFENHLNVFHSSKQGLSRDVAHGLSVFLNSTTVDDYFRRFSGHTQVNATDLRLLKYPELGELEELGRWLQTQRQPLAQGTIDQQLEALHGRGK